MEELYGKVGDGLVKRRQVFAATLIRSKTISLAVSYQSAPVVRTVRWRTVVNRFQWDWSSACDHSAPGRPPLRSQIPSSNERYPNCADREAIPIAASLTNNSRRRTPARFRQFGVSPDSMASTVSASWRTPSRRRAAWLVVADVTEIDATEQAFVTALLSCSSNLAQTVALARAFRTMVRQQRAGELDERLLATDGTAMSRFAGGLKRDLAAVRAALSLPWSTGPVEGQISRLKTIKRGLMEQTPPAAPAA